MNFLTPSQIVSELDRFIVGQNEAKKAVAIALRNRWRRQQVPSPLKEEILPKNILMIGATGVGKTEIARRLAKLAEAPFVKVEATKFTEVGYVGRDVEQIIRDLIEVAVFNGMLKQPENHIEGVNFEVHHQLSEISTCIFGVAVKNLFKICVSILPILVFKEHNRTPEKGIVIGGA